MNSIKKQIITRVLELLGALKSDGESQVREVERKRDLFLQAAKYPAVHVIDGAEIPGEAEEDNIGYTLEFPLVIKVMVEDQRDPYSATDELVPFIQKIIESDTQLSGLANWVRFEGETPFVHEINKPLAGSLVNYRIQYRRKRGEPEANY
jgi:hypothetical protein